MLEVPKIIFPVGLALRTSKEETSLKDKTAEFILSTMCPLFRTQTQTRGSTANDQPDKDNIIINCIHTIYRQLSCEPL